MDKSFHKDERLRRKQEFDNVFKSGTRVHGRYCVLYVKPENSRKLGVIVSKKVSKKAVDRNRFKRWFREIFRNNKDELSSKVHLILLAKPGIAQGSFDEVYKDVIRTFSKITY